VTNALIVFGSQHGPAGSPELPQRGVRFGSAKAPHPLMLGVGGTFDHVDEVKRTP
jgi:hypothetical protein